jgi:hypothetical protein
MDNSKWFLDEDGEPSALLLKGFHILYCSDPFPETWLNNNCSSLGLNGDFRDDYEKLSILGYDACLKFYRDNADDYANEKPMRLPPMKKKK